MSIDERHESEVDRRRPTAGVRASWASDRPFVTDSAPAVLVTTTEQGGSLPAPSGARLRRRAAWERPYMWAVLVIDVLLAAAVAAGTALASWPGTLATAALAVAIAVPVWATALAFCGGYRTRRMGSGPEEFQSVMHAAFAVIAVIGLTAYATQTLLPRRYVLVAVPLLAVLDAVGRYLARRWLHRQRHAGRAMMRTLVVGSHAQAEPVARGLAREPFHGYDVVGICPPALGRGEAGSLPVLGSVSDVAQVVWDHAIDVVVVTGGSLSGAALRRLSWALERTDADLVVAPGLVEVAGPRVTLRPTAGLSLVYLERQSQHFGRGLGKAVLDRTLGLAMLLVATVPVLVCAAAVSLTSPGAPFFRQTRAGIDGRPFTMWKLRSMVTDAEKRRDELLDSSDRDGLMFKMHADPRVTPVGRVLRRFSLDELPQLWNVVRGDMSLVGPRPPLISEFEQYHDAVNRRLRVKPGLTGLWQVSGRADLTWEESVNLDLRYVDNWSLAMDLLILWKTFRVVVRGSGAY